MTQNLTHQIESSKEPAIRSLLKSAGYSFAPADHAYWRARDGQTTVTFYKSGKLLFQGESPEAAASLLVDAGLLAHPIEPPAKQASHPPAPPFPPSPPSPPLLTWIGTDESGKGDYFGPLTVAGVLATSDTENELLRLGVRDSKQLSDSTIQTLAPQIRSLCPSHVATITPREYNELYIRMKNLNRLLAWGHARSLS